MSNTPSTTDPDSHFRIILNDALERFQKRTGKDLTSHPLLRDNPIARQSPKDFLVLLQSEGLYSDLGQRESSRGTVTSTKWLDKTVDTVNQVFQVISPGVSIVS
jgi:hypothetical protein